MRRVAYIGDIPDFAAGVPVPPAFTGVGDIVAGESSFYEWDAANKRFGTVQRTQPSMTGPTAPAGYEVVDTANFNAGSPSWGAWKADAALGRGYVDTAANPTWTRFKFPAAQVVSGYAMITTSLGRCPTSWKMQGSDDAAAWTDLDAHVGDTEWTGGVQRKFAIAAPAAYLYYRLYMTAFDGTGFAPDFYALRLFLGFTDSTFRLYAAAKVQPAGLVPSRGYVVARIGGPASPNVNVFAEISRDDGTTWTRATSLVKARDLADGTALYAAFDIDISAQPAGVQMKARMVFYDPAVGLDTTYIYGMDWGGY